MQHNKSAATECDHPTYPEFKDEFGEDPARFLYHTDDPAPRLRGIKDVELLRAYQTVEAEKDESDKSLIAGINQRILSLQEMDASAEPADVSPEEVATDGGVKE